MDEMAISFIQITKAILNCITYLLIMMVGTQPSDEIYKIFS